MIDITPFSPAHQAGIVDLILSIQQQEYGISITLEAQPDLLDIAGFYQKGRGNFWVALDGDAVVGTIALLDIGSNQAALRKMFVHKDYRGTEKGIARKLLRALLEWSFDHDIGDIFLGTTSAFLAAHRFYEKSGFVEIPQNQLPTAFPRMAVDSKFYRYRAIHGTPTG